MMIMTENMNQTMDGNNLTEKLLNYFNKTNKKTLEVLDNKYRTYYTGVSLNYLTYDLLKAKYKKSEVASCLLDLHKTEQIKGLYCNDIKKYVLEPLRSNHGNFSPITGDSDWGVNGTNLHIYLKQFIKKMKNE